MKRIFSNRTLSKIVLGSRYPQLFRVTEQAVTATMSLTRMYNLSTECQNLQRKNKIAIAVDLVFKPCFLQSSIPTCPDPYLEW